MRRDLSCVIIALLASTTVDIMKMQESDVCLYAIKVTFKEKV